MDSIRRQPRFFRRREFVKLSFLGALGFSCTSIFSPFTSRLSEDNGHYTNQALLTINSKDSNFALNSIESFYEIFPAECLNLFNQALDIARSKHVLLHRQIEFVGSNKIRISTRWKTKNDFVMIYGQSEIRHAVAELKKHGIFFS